jgi:hypothetical protein
MDIVYEKDIVCFFDREYLIETSLCKDKTIKTEIYPRMTQNKFSSEPIYAIEFNDPNDIQFNHWAVVELLRFADKQM